ncbi:TPA: hypothetical protein ACGA4O_003620 [Acinetobacter baumannii]|nr:hypothetical protein [Acinetobacter baumannii]
MQHKQEGETRSKPVIKLMGFLLLCPTSLEHWITMCWTGFLVDA